MIKKLLFIVLLVHCYSMSLAHPMPSSMVELSVLEKTIYGEARIPMLELGNAVGDSMGNLQGNFLRHYLLSHIRAEGKQGFWETEIVSISKIQEHSPIVGDYEEAIVRFRLVPNQPGELRKFILHYDVVIHQVVTHSAWVWLKQDWRNGIVKESPQQVGEIRLDIPTGKILPLTVDLGEGSLWSGFKGMVSLGMDHISDGTDHLLFLLVLLLPAVLVTDGRHWGSGAGLKASLLRLFRIVTAFTVGHSLTLLLGSTGWLRIPSQPVEILIAISIMVSAMHAIRPLFPGKESLVAGGFGLVHGMAFATVLANLQLNKPHMALSILGFNLGIELMQMAVIIVTIPWLILLGSIREYSVIRIAGAAFAALASAGWILERISGNANAITELLEQLTPYRIWCLCALALIAVIVYLINRFNLSLREWVS